MKGAVAADALINVGFIVISVALLATQAPAMINDINVVLTHEKVTNEAREISNMLSIAKNAPDEIKITHTMPSDDYSVRIGKDGVVEVCDDSYCGKSESFVQFEEELDESDVGHISITKSVEDGVSVVDVSKISILAASVGASECIEYAVVTGDTLWDIAIEFYGDGVKWPIIYEANKEVIGDNPNLILVGQVLCIPEISSEGTG